MFRKLTLAAGFGAGYVLGAKAGTQRYDQIMQKANELMGKPAVQDFTSSVSSSASAAADKAKSTVNDKVTSVSGSSSSTDEVVVDLGTTTTPDTALGSPLGGTTSSSSIGSASTLGTSSTSTLGTGSTTGTGSTSGTSSTYGTGASTYGSTTPGAAPSDTAPDVL